jgi:hypothetical protein
LAAANSRTNHAPPQCKHWICGFSAISPPNGRIWSDAVGEKPVLMILQPGNVRFRHDSSRFGARCTLNNGRKMSGTFQKILGEQRSDWLPRILGPITRLLDVNTLDLRRFGRFGEFTAEWSNSERRSETRGSFFNFLIRPSCSAAREGWISA